MNSENTLSQLPDTFVSVRFNESTSPVVQSITILEGVLGFIEEKCSEKELRVVSSWLDMDMKMRLENKKDEK